MTTHGSEVTRREALAVGLVGAAGLAAGAVGCTPAAEPAPDGGAVRSASGDRMPVVFLPHGGGPWPFVEVGFGDRSELDALATHLRDVRSMPRSTPKALLVISAHWEEDVPTVTTSERPPMLYDYYGFPPASYQITWPAPGEPQLAARVLDLLGGAGFATATDAERGFDHGTFVPLKLTYPEADIPTVQLSLVKGLDPAQHLALGRALMPLRDEGVFIVGSGMTFHDLRGLRNPRSKPAAAAFDAWLQEAATREASERDRRLTGWASAPSARAAHPREEHLLPLMVVAGAAGSDVGSVAFDGTLMGLRHSGYRFG
jgi:aromatic ring-opening dioxygenase catalytic subunit (LigB family)